MATLLMVGVGDVAAVAEFFGAFKVADLLDKGCDFGFVADRRVGELRVGELADFADEVVSLSACLAVQDAIPDARDDVGGEVHGWSPFWCRSGVAG